ncbi:hypothetical protein ANN_08709 [Periplaneta americana]|uniref:Transposable element P transposase-like RNase H domain-containing protein n=1 Tax=Periplaneta americana TaxID=6978 RepID=A0ABQ8T274_PERAM|nr:hypothetical protein ANN_08709 [Periplaneta americana]
MSTSTSSTESVDKTESYDKTQILDKNLNAEPEKSSAQDFAKFDAEVLVRETGKQVVGEIMIAKLSGEKRKEKHICCKCVEGKRDYEDTTPLVPHFKIRLDSEAKLSDSEKQLSDKSISFVDKSDLYVEEQISDEIENGSGRTFNGGFKVKGTEIPIDNNVDSVCKTDDHENIDKEAVDEYCKFLKEDGNTDTGTCTEISDIPEGPGDIVPEMITHIVKSDFCVCCDCKNKIQNQQKTVYIHCQSEKSPAENEMSDAEMVLNKSNIHCKRMIHQQERRIESVQELNKEEIVKEDIIPTVKQTTHYIEDVILHEGIRKQALQMGLDILNMSLESPLDVLSEISLKSPSESPLETSLEVPSKSSLKIPLEIPSESRLESFSTSSSEAEYGCICSPTASIGEEEEEEGEEDESESSLSSSELEFLLENKNAEGQQRIHIGERGRSGLSSQVKYSEISSSEDRSKTPSQFAVQYAQIRNPHISFQVFPSDSSTNYYKYLPAETKYYPINAAVGSIPEEKEKDIPFATHENNRYNSTPLKSAVDYKQENSEGNELIYSTRTPEIINHSDLSMNRDNENNITFALNRVGGTETSQKYSTVKTNHKSDDNALINPNNVRNWPEINKYFVFTATPDTIDVSNKEKQHKSVTSSVFNNSRAIECGLGFYKLTREGFKFVSGGIEEPIDEKEKNLLSTSSAEIDTCLLPEYTDEGISDTDPETGFPVSDEKVSRKAASDIESQNRSTEGAVLPPEIHDDLVHTMHESELEVDDEQSQYKWLVIKGQCALQKGDGNVKIIPKDVLGLIENFLITSSDRVLDKREEVYNRVKEIVLTDLKGKSLAITQTSDLAHVEPSALKSKDDFHKTLIGTHDRYIEYTSDSNEVDEFDEHYKPHIIEKNYEVDEASMSEDSEVIAIQYRQHLSEGTASTSALMSMKFDSEGELLNDNEIDKKDVGYELDGEENIQLREKVAFHEFSHEEFTSSSDEEEEEEEEEEELSMEENVSVEGNEERQEIKSKSPKKESSFLSLEKYEQKSSEDVEEEKESALGEEKNSCEETKSEFLRSSCIPLGKQVPFRKTELPKKEDGCDKYKEGSSDKLNVRSGAKESSDDKEERSSSPYDASKSSTVINANKEKTTSLKEPLEESNLVIYKRGKAYLQLSSQERLLILDTTEMIAKPISTNIESQQKEKCDGSSSAISNSLFLKCADSIEFENTKRIQNDVSLHEAELVPRTVKRKKEKQNYKCGFFSKIKIYFTKKKETKARLKKEDNHQEEVHDIMVPRTNTRIDSSDAKYIDREQKDKFTTQENAVVSDVRIRTGYGGKAANKHFFTPPKDKDEFYKWSRAIPRKDRPLSRTSSICDSHFSDDFIVKVDAFCYKDEDENNKYGVLIFDEVKLREEIQFNNATLKVDGFVDFGYLTPDTHKHQLANHALVFMFIPFLQSWVQPVAIYASRNAVPGDILAKIFIQVILQLEEAGARVVGFTCDGSQTNKKA